MDIQVFNRYFTIMQKINTASYRNIDAIHLLISNLFTEILTASCVEKMFALASINNCYVDIRLLPNCACLLHMREHITSADFNAKFKKIYRNSALVICDNYFVVNVANMHKIIDSYDNIPEYINTYFEYKSQLQIRHHDKIIPNIFEHSNRIWLIDCKISNSKLDNYYTVMFPIHYFQDYNIYQYNINNLYDCVIDNNYVIFQVNKTACINKQYIFILMVIINTIAILKSKCNLSMDYRSHLQIIMSIFNTALFYTCIYRAVSD